MTDDEGEALKWAGDEERIRQEHEMERISQKNGIGSNPGVDPYTYARVHILLRRLDEARTEIARLQAVCAFHKIPYKVE